MTDKMNAPSSRLIKVPNQNFTVKSSKFCIVFAIVLLSCFASFLFGLYYTENLTLSPSYNIWNLNDNHTTIATRNVNDNHTTIATILEENLITLITGYWRIDDHYHPLQTYQKYMSHWVPYISTPMVILTNDKFFINYVLQHRFNNYNTSNNTILIYISAQQLFTFTKYYSTYILHKETLNISTWNPLLAVIYNAKFGLLYNLSIWNPFNSKYFGWIDIGAFRRHYDKLFILPNNSKTARLWPSHTIIRQTFSKCAHCVLFAMPKINVIQAGFFIGTRKAIEWLNIEFYKTHDLFIEHNIYVNKEENIMQMMVGNDIILNTSRILLLNSIGSSTHCNWWHWMYFQLYFSDSNACITQRMQCVKHSNTIDVANSKQINFRYVFRKG
eukprot:184013_1